MPKTYPIIEFRIRGVLVELWLKFKSLCRAESVRLDRTISLNSAIITLIEQAVKRGRINGD